MRIALIGAGQLPESEGEVSSYIFELSSSLATDDREVIAYTKKRIFGRAKVFNGVLLKPMFFFAPYLFAALHASLITRADIIHFHNRRSAVWSWIPRFFRPEALVVTSFYRVSPRLSLLERIAVRFSHDYIATKKFVANDFFARFGIRSHVIPRGIYLRRVAMNDIVLEGLGLRSMNYIAAFVESDDGLSTLLQAWHELREKNSRFAHFRLAIVGRVKYRTDDHSVIFVGHQTEEVRSAIFAGACFVVSPEERRVRLDASFEAMSYGKAVVTVNHLDNKECEDVCAFQYLPGDIETLSRRMNTLLVDPMLTASIGHAAREFVESEYRWQDIAMKTIEVYSDIMSTYEERSHARAV